MTGRITLWKSDYKDFKGLWYASQYCKNYTVKIGGEKMKLRKIDIIALVLFFIFIISIVTFLVGVIIKNPISLIGAILYYLLVFYLLIVGWMGGFE